MSSHVYVDSDMSRNLKDINQLETRIAADLAEDEESDKLVDLSALSQPLHALERAGRSAGSRQAGHSAYLGIRSLDTVLCARGHAQMQGVHAYHCQDGPSDEPWVSQPVQGIQTLTKHHIQVARMCFKDAADEVNLNNKHVIRRAASLLHALDNTLGHVLDDASGSICRTRKLLGSHYGSLLVSAKPVQRSLDLADFIDACIHYQERGLTAVLEHLGMDVRGFALATLDSWASSESDEISEGQLWCLEKIFAQFATPLTQPDPGAQSWQSPRRRFWEAGTSDGAVTRYTLQTSEALKLAACCAVPHLSFMDHNWDQIHSLFRSGEVEGPGIAEFSELCVWLKARGHYYLGTKAFAGLEVGGWLSDLTITGWLTCEELVNSMVGRIMAQLTSVSDGLINMSDELCESMVAAADTAEKALRAVPGMTKERAEALSRTVVQNANAMRLTEDLEHSIRNRTNALASGVLNAEVSLEGAESYLTEASLKGAESIVQTATLYKGSLRSRVRRALGWRAKAGSGSSQVATYGSQAAAEGDLDLEGKKSSIRRDITAGLKARADARAEMQLTRRKEALAVEEAMSRDNLVLGVAGGLAEEEMECVAEGTIAASPMHLDRGGHALKSLQVSEVELPSSFAPQRSKLPHSNNSQIVYSRRPNTWRHQIDALLQGEEEGHPVPMSPQAQAAAAAVAEARMRVLAEEAERERLQSLPVAVVEAETEAKAKESERALLDSRALADAQAHTLAQLLQRVI